MHTQKIVCTWDDMSLVHTTRASPRLLMRFKVVLPFDGNMVKDFGFSLGLYPNEVLSSNQAQYRTRSAAH
jgi:hypothetical protein